ncbi:hypothetical protein THAOC_01394 [Thalassiosira oceanica]|uniref:DUF7640 domain-containing protein n=1 Tax=Thalassiosira oceanica TaxID=159749 RepID=K0TQX8_THAOC|nr:hypothetical protein THAOC_01394 [Thalassiosira oceanica]|eukprot:EJK76822.1 hypothetical protein THAOC_01394 [Thalassiosira oceanica]
MPPPPPPPWPYRLSTRTAESDGASIELRPTIKDASTSTMLVHPSAVNSLVLVGSLGLGSAAASKGRIRERLLQKKDLLSSSGAPPFNAKNRRGDGRPGRKERRAKIAELESESSTEEIPPVDIGVIAAPVASKLDVGFVDCVDGYVRDDEGVTSQACDGNCCVGSLACKYFTGRVAKDGSCDGNYACRYSRIDDVVRAQVVLEDSCYATSAQSITDSSCTGEQACPFLSSLNGDEKSNVSDGSCVGRFACYDAGTAGVLGPSISASCIGVNSCSFAGRYGSVGDLVGSCNSDSACEDMGRYVSVGNVMNGCNGDGEQLESNAFDEIVMFFSYSSRSRPTPGTCQSVAEEETQSVSAIVDCYNAPDGICDGVTSSDGLESESDTSPFTEKQLCYGKIAVEIAAASLSKGHSMAAVRYSVNKAIDDLGCNDKSDSKICVFLNDELEILQL